MKIESRNFLDRGPLPEKFSCDGEEINPSLTITNVPQEAKSLAIVLSDPDAPNETFYHWLIWNINPEIETINEGEVPEGAMEGTNSIGTQGYTGPCPPSGIHHYVFTLYALSDILDLNPAADINDFNAAINGYQLSSAEIIATFERPKP